MIQNQVKLPLKVALGVVLQGVRIRFGRSVVTIMGVCLGIAFLMAIVAGQVIKEGVREEDRARTELRRMRSFLVAEAGLPTERIIGVVQVGPLSDLERRLIERIDEDKPAAFKWATLAGSEPVLDLRNAERRPTPAEEVGVDAHSVLVVGDGDAPSLDWAAVLASSRQPSLALTRKRHTATAPEGASVARLAREPRPEEIAKMQAERRKERFRRVWIVVISVFVTVIGISNAMLMSVTERFREIGTMKCLGALSAFIRRLFLLESGLMGIVGGLIGGAFGVFFALVAYSLTYGPGLVLGSLDVGTLFVYFCACQVASVVLSILAALYPASVAAAMVPATALRTDI